MDKTIDKVLVKFKAFPEDFIVEEIGQDYLCEVSKSKEELDQAKLDFGKLNLEDKRDYLICDLEKINLDHFSAFEILSKKIGIHLGDIGYAGTKDKAAWTCQRISIYEPDLNKLKKFSFNGLILKNFKWSKYPVRIGELTGNKFRIVLRDADKEAIKILKKVRNSTRLPNFFGSQRFGSLRGDNFEIGKLIFKRKFKEAIWTILTGYGEEESDEVKKAKKRLAKEKDIIAAKSYFPENLRQEHRILDHLAKKPNDWFNALGTIPEKTLLIICQSVQSKIFNDILKRVIDEEIPLLDNEIMLPGYETILSQNQLGKIEKEVMDSNGLKFSEFHLREIPFLMFRGSYRKAFSKVSDLVVETESDEIYPGSKKIILSFSLDSGTYATTFLEQFFELG